MDSHMNTRAQGPPLEHTALMFHVTHAILLHNPRGIVQVRARNYSLV